ncbi:MAG: hypothetical protein ACI31M_02220 [Bacilli bacterium]
MLKLNNKGWGMSTMIVCTSLILVALLITSFYVIRLYSQIDDITDSSNSTEEEKIDYSVYHKMETDLGNGAVNYLKELSINLNDLSYNITYETLKTHNFVNKFVDIKTNKECIGYVVVDNNYRYDAFIKCDSYETEGYNNK